MALTADKKTEWMEGRDIVIKGVVLQTIYAGALVMGVFDEQGMPAFQPAADVSGPFRVIGVALEGKECADNIQSLSVRTKGIFKFKFNGTPNLKPLGMDVYVVDDETVSCDATTNNIVAGKLVKVDDDPNYAWVRIG